MGIPEDRTFYSSSYFGMVDLYLGNGMEVYAAALLIAVVCAIVVYNIFYISVMGKMREYGRLKIQARRDMVRRRWSCLETLGPCCWE